MTIKEIFWTIFYSVLIFFILLHTLNQLNKNDPFRILTFPWGYI